MSAALRPPFIMSTDLTILIPAYNEADNLRDVLPDIAGVVRALDRSFELLVVDDGSDDDTIQVLRDVGDELPELVTAHLGRNGGKSTALQHGFGLARGEVVILMDADGQDDPREIKGLLDALDGGLDQVTGRRATRNDRFIKRLTSRLYNWTTAKVTGVPGKDFNSGLKAMRRDVVESLELYGELHRYIPILANWNGFRVGEVDVEHHSRLHGTTKFGRSRFWRGFLDLITVKFLTTYNARPFHLFGGVGAVLGAVGSALLVWMAVLKLSGETIGNRPALLIGVFFVVVAVQLMSFGLLAELLVHYRRPGSTPAQRTSR